MRPRAFDEVAGQAHLLGPDAVLRRAVEGDTFRAVILHGPPGTGKTTLARLMAEKSGCRFVALNAVLSGVADLRAAVAEAESRRRLEGASTLVFIDELHRYNRAQQDALLPSVEEGVIRFIGATTYNPLLHHRTSSRPSSSVKPSPPPTCHPAHRRPDPRGFGGRYTVDPALLDMLARAAGGDARRGLTLLEAVVQGARTRTIGPADLPEGLSLRPTRHDREGDDHYDIVSAFIKSMRGSDLDATVYWLARMIAAGEDPRFIARRIMIQAAEDVGPPTPRPRVAVAAHAAAEGGAHPPRHGRPLRGRCPETPPPTSRSRRRWRSSAGNLGGA
jgi:putative ATPase